MVADFGANRALIASRPSQQVVSTEGFNRGEGFILKAWDVTVEGYGVDRVNAASRGKALAKAWRCDAFNRLTFGDFLKIAAAHRAMFVEEGFGAPIAVGGKPAFYVGRNRAYVHIVYPGGEHVLSAHPSDVEPESFRPEAYRTLARIEARSDATPKSDAAGTARAGSAPNSLGGLSQ